MTDFVLKAITSTRWWYEFVLSILPLSKHQTFDQTFVKSGDLWEGYCLVQRIEPGRLSGSGSRIWFVLEAGANGAYIDKITFSQGDPDGPPYSSLEVPIELPHDAFRMAPNEQKGFYLNYHLDDSKPLLIAVDFAALPYVSTVGWNDQVRAEEARAYYRLNSDGGPWAQKKVRESFDDWDGVCLVKHIDVVGLWWSTPQ
jgi:hypothetical protein